jgi:hypothetical protein
MLFDGLGEHLLDKKVILLNLYLREKINGKNIVEYS